MKAIGSIEGLRKVGNRSAMGNKGTQPERRKC